jgi:hypothetical protein
MGVPIFNANSVPLNQNSGTMPDVSGALQNWFQPMQFTQVAKVVNSVFQLSETPTTYAFMGVWQPAQPSNLEIKLQGQRKWKWFTVHASPGIPLSPDDVVNYLGVQYRVMSMNDYTLNGYIEYRLINDYTGSGP